MNYLEKNKIKKFNYNNFVSNPEGLYCAFFSNEDT